MSPRWIATRCLLLTGLVLALTTAVAHAEDFTTQIPSRTQLAVLTTTGTAWGTANQHESRAALSTAKLYIVDYALRHGDHAPADITLAEKMIRFSDDGAAEALSGKYPSAITAVAAEYGLDDTHAGAHWGYSTTSVADLVAFIAAKQHTDPDSPILRWMADAGDVAADGTEQNWGTAQLPGVQGTKWGWADRGTAAEVASVSYGPGFVVAAITYGSPENQTADVTQAVTPLLLHRNGIH